MELITHRTWENVGAAALIEEKSRTDPIAAGLVVLDGDLGGDTPLTALNKMAGHKILAAPVLLPGGRYSMVDLAAIAIALASHMDNATLPIAALCTISEKGQALDINSDLKTLVARLVEKNVHRILITLDDKPHNILSQIDVINHLCHYPELIPKALQKVSAKDIMTQNPICIDRHEAVIEAIKKCAADAFSGAAVLDDHGQIFANFSISDLREMYGKDFAHLMSMSVDQFLKQTHTFVKLPVTIHPDDPAEQALKLMHRHHVHRVHVVGEDDKPVGVITATDMLRAVHEAHDRNNAQDDALTSYE